MSGSKLFRNTFSPRRHSVAGAVLLILAAALAATLAGCSANASSSAKSVSATRAGESTETVVLLHGLGRSPRAMWRLAERLEEAGYAVHSLGYSSLGETPEAILADLSGQIDACCADRAGRVHFVGHSLGGLLIRAYLAEHKPANLGRVVLLGTPSHGTALVDKYRDNWWFAWLGPTALALGTSDDSLPNQLGRPDYPLGVIAGRKQSDNEDVLPGEDDGLVTVESTRVDGMADFQVIDVGHAAMRHDPRVAAQTIAFLTRGRFDRGALSASN